MTYLKNTIKNTLDFFKDTKFYFRDVLLLHCFMLFILVPGLVWLARFIMVRGGVDYLSYTNIGEIIKQHLFVFVGLVVLVLLVILTVYFEFTFLNISMYFIKKKQEIGLKQLLWATLLQLKHLRISLVLFFLFYFFLILPFGGLASHTDILSNIKIPAFIMDFIFTNRRLFVALWVVWYLFCLYIGIRLIFALPEMTLRNRSFRESVRESWAITKRKFFQIVGQILLITVCIFVGYAVANFLILGVQKLIEQYFSHYALYTAVIAMVLLQICSVLNLVLSTIMIYYVVIDYMDDEGILPEIPGWYKVDEVKEQKNGFFASSVFVGVAAAIFGVGLGVFNLNYLTNNELSDPIVLSHRGVSEGVGVQNTIPALEQVVKLKPNYVEIDVQETKDKQFVLMHDPNLKDLAEINATVGQLTLKELTSLTLKENGQKAKLTSFDEYLKCADAVGQKLLIEIKVYDHYSEDIVDNFVNKYRGDILSRGHRLHSLSYNVVTRLKELEPKFYCNYILPFNLVGPPISEANGFTMEYSTLNSGFVDAAHGEGKEVYAWTVNDADSIERMRSYGVDGIITDDVQRVQKMIEKNQGNMTYSDKLLIYALGLDVG
ncbi:MAG: glycerophosphodiester phosphodiesterase [Lactobacillales bacterium]|nr:glycerophosphodiester phosphodiesterase [Lactobacillales bacterium]